MEKHHHHLLYLSHIIMTSVWSVFKIHTIKITQKIFTACLKNTTKLTSHPSHPHNICYYLNFEFMRYHKRDGINHEFMFLTIRSLLVCFFFGTLVSTISTRGIITL
uniref:Uncharacterized protein n=1 Tax=Cacopsylla melanoneura TaxID=428564 RepID=A0A8D8W6G1_9HEMI